MLLGLFLFCSCSSSDSFENVDVNNVMSEESLQEDQLVSVQSQIDSLNQEMFTSSYETRGFWKFFTKIVCTVFADAVGGLVGAGLSVEIPLLQLRQPFLLLGLWHLQITTNYHLMRM